MVIKLPTGKITKTLKEVEEFMITPDGVERKLDGVVDKVLDGEFTHGEWNENDSDNFADSDDVHILQKIGIAIKSYEEWKISKSAI